MEILSLSSDTNEDGSAMRLDAGPNLDIQAAEILASLLYEAADSGKPLIVDASSVERMSTSAVQLFLAADRSFAETTSALTLRNPSDTFMAAFADCGVRPQQMNWIVQTETGND
jgi:anti-anti-sigma regulatory factor